MHFACAKYVPCSTYDRRTNIRVYLRAQQFDRLTNNSIGEVTRMADKRCSYAPLPQCTSPHKTHKHTRDAVACTHMLTCRPENGGRFRYIQTKRESSDNPLSPSNHAHSPPFIHSIERVAWLGTYDSTIHSVLPPRLAAALHRQSALGFACCRRRGTKTK